MQTENTETQALNKKSGFIEKAALTRAEAEQLLAEKRDRIYHCVMTASIVFAVVSAVMMMAFKRYEGFFDANSRIGLLMERVNMQETKASAPKLNVRTTFRDENNSRLVLPLKEPVADSNIDRKSVV